MAEAVGLAASVIGIAAFAESVVLTFQSFVSSYTRAEFKIIQLSNDLAVISTTLRRLGETIKKDEDKLRVEACDLFVAAEGNCQRIFDRLEKALRKARKDKKPMSAWEKLQYACGEEDELDDLMKSIEASKSTLTLVWGYVRISILQKQHDLDEQKTEELMLLWQEVFREVRRQGNPKVEAKNNQVQPDTAPTEVESNDTNGKLTGNNGADVSEGLRDWKNHFDNASSPLELERVAPQPLRAGSPQHTQAIGSRPFPQLATRAAEQDFDGNSPRQSDPRSIRHEDNIGEPDHLVEVKEEISQNKPCECIHAASLYEGWLLCHAPTDMDERSFKTLVFCKLKLHINYKPDPPGYATFPFSLDQKWLEDCVFDRSSKEPNTPRQGRQEIIFIMSTLPVNACNEIVELLEIRNRAATLPNHWITGAILPAPDIKFSAWMKLPYSERNKNTGSRDTYGRWLIVLRGGAPYPSVENLPRRHGDPWSSAKTHKMIGTGEHDRLFEPLQRIVPRSTTPSVCSSCEKLALERTRRELECRPALQDRRIREDYSLSCARKEYEFVRRKRVENSKEETEEEKRDDEEQTCRENEEEYLYTEEEAKKMMENFLKIFADKDVETDLTAGKEQNST